MLRYAQPAVKTEEYDVDPLVDIGHLRVLAAVHPGEVNPNLELVAGEKDIVGDGHYDEEDVEGGDGEDGDAEDKEGVEAPALTRLRFFPARTRRPLE